jgi:hypothetical protein
LAARSGARAGRVRLSNGKVTDVGADEGEGVVNECISRALGLPTPPPPAPPQQLVALEWLEDLIAGARVDPPEMLPADVEWDLIQEGLMNGRWTDCEVTPRLAAWMDTGMLARWLLGRYPPLEVMLRRLDDAIGTDASGWARAEVRRLLPPPPAFGHGTARDAVS